MNKFTLVININLTETVVKEALFSNLIFGQE